jgi:hypothetical protein
MKFEKEYVTQIFLVGATLIIMLLLTSLVHASPLYPWYQSNCSQITQNDGKIIGGVCSDFDSEVGIAKITVYYKGYLMDDSKYHYLDTNLSLNGGGFFRRTLKEITVGDGNDLPEMKVYYGEYIATTSFNQSFPTGANFKIYFEAEEIVPTHAPPFVYDNLFGNNYAGSIKAVEY